MATTLSSNTDLDPCSIFDLFWIPDVDGTYFEESFEHSIEIGTGD